ncbi:MAG: carbamoyl phosphate synthase small subunit [Mycoplasmataceae bacterium]|jgi:carbamoyl-phosphate synthase small subunit|nr:carbamoyl phosphate synthase small subunit [Mycoplasmataceae bacterium]
MPNTKYLILDNGMVFTGTEVGAQTESIFEIVYNVSTNGYAAILSDPSYYGQGIVFTYPQIGNYGYKNEKLESDRFAASGIIVNELTTGNSQDSEDTLQKALEKYNIPGIQGIDTRYLAKLIRKNGTIIAKISNSNKNISKQIKEMKEKYHPTPIELITTKTVKKFGLKNKYKIAAYDFGIKQSIIDNLVERDCEVHLYPFQTDAKVLIGKKYDGFLLSPGPGDPEENVVAIKNVKALLQTKTPLFGICMGHQILGIASGYKTAKLGHGHRGPNQPVLQNTTGKIFITAQNHGYYVKLDNTNKNIGKFFTNIDDDSNEGLIYKNKPVFSVQFHPEASAGPNDTKFLFDLFLKNVKEYYATK